MKHYTNNSSPWMCTYDWRKAIESIPPEERYRICCQLIGKDNVDEILKGFAKPPLKRWLWKSKRKLKKTIRKIKRRYLDNEDIS